MFRKKRSPQISLVGLELDAGHVAAAEVTVNGSITVTRGGVAELRPGVMRDGEVADPIALAEAIKALFAEHDLPKRVRLGIAHQRIVVRTLDLPGVFEDPKELAAAVRAAAPDHIPMPMDEAVLDFQPLGVVQTAPGRARASSSSPSASEMVERARRGRRGRRPGDRGHRPVGVRHGPGAPSDHAGAILYINVAGLVNVAVANAGGCLFTRASAGGIDAIAHRSPSAAGSRSSTRASG